MLLRTKKIGEIFNEQDEKNRNLAREKREKQKMALERLVEIVLFLGENEMSFRGHDETNNSKNRGKYLNMIEFVKKIDPLFKYNLETLGDRKFESSKFQNKVLSLIKSVYEDEIKQEVSEVKHAALIADETTEISRKNYVSILIRYIKDKDKEVKERFIGFFEPENANAKGITDLILSKVTDFNAQNKIVAQIYDGAATMSGGISGVQKRIRDVEKNAIFIHCFAHRVNLVIKDFLKTEETIKEVYLQSRKISAFFNHSPKRNKVLQQKKLKAVPKFSETRWNYFSEIVSYLVTNCASLIDCFEYIENKAKYNKEENIRCRKFRMFLLSNSENNFLPFIEKLMSHLNILSKSMQAVNLTIFEANTKSGKTITKLGEISEAFTGSEMFDVHVQKIIMGMKSRFENLVELDFMEILRPQIFLNYSKNFPYSNFTKLLREYKHLRINENKLKSELIVLYSEEEAKNGGFFELREFIEKENYMGGYSEISTVLNVFITIGTSTASAERSFSTLRRIKNFLRNKSSTNRTSSLVILSFEREYIRHLV